MVFTLLWTSLLIVPGIVAAFRYSLTFYILNDDPTIGVTGAIDQSKAVMGGNKWKAFCLGWRFLGWKLLSLATCGIGGLWLLPYMATSFARFYDDLRTARRATAGR
jgi:uncharacterized membrane protein